jgi:pimeloyl-ACP methyl ester carboxylesterase
MKTWPSLAPFGKTLSIIGGEFFYYDSAGDADSNDNTVDKPTVILVHGLGDEADTWRHVFHLFVDAGYRVIAPDLPGFGRSLWKGRINMRSHCRVILRLMTMPGVASAEKPAALIGSSLGAGIVEMAACKRPDLVKKLILIDGCFPFSYRRDRGMILLSLPFIGKGWYRGFRSNHGAAWRSLYPYYSNMDAMSDEDRDFLRERVIARVESVNQERGYFATLRSMSALLLFGKRAMTKKIQAFPGKVLILWGDGDRVFPPDKAALLRSLRPDAGFTFIAGAGHLPHQEKPDICAAEMLRFLKEE